MTHPAKPEPGPVDLNNTPGYADLVGLPYRSGGRSLEPDGPTAGIDCYGVVRAYLARLGVDLPEDQAGALADARTLGMRASGEPPRRGDVLVLEGAALPTAEREVHVAVMIDNFRCLHATREAGSVVERVDAITARCPVRSVLRPRPLAFGIERDGHDGRCRGGDHAC